MERLLLLRLRATGCDAEVRVNDIPVARTPKDGGHVDVPVHEYLLEGANELALVAHVGLPNRPPPPKLLETTAAASVRLLLPRIGAVGSELSARTLAEIDWALPAGELLMARQSTARSVALPLKFPRWRWLDAPPVEPLAAQPLVAAFVQQLAVSLAKGDPDLLLQAARLRFEELAVAYQQPVADLAARWRARIQMLHATQALKIVIPDSPDVLVRPVAGGRLLECLGADGEPILRTAPADDGTRQAWPLRVAVVENHCHVMR